ncbi:hypothetical protein [Streptomyces sp. NPDC014733]|uniref:hypothetical protein n=1 Tax=Streptomyces sp. NPDC014733 TaxID=3364885 RepID=UPI0036F80369
MAKLPENSVLKKLILKGFSDDEIAATYEVSRQAVCDRRILLGIRRKAELTTYVGSLIPWSVKTLQYGKGTHHTAHALESLKLFLRSRLDDESLSQRQKDNVARFNRRLLKYPSLVLDYDRESEKGFKWVDRQPADGGSIIRWPAEVETPSAEVLDLFKMPDPSESDGSSS